MYSTIPQSHFAQAEKQKTTEFDPKKFIMTTNLHLIKPENNLQSFQL